MTCSFTIRSLSLSFFLCSHFSEKRKETFWRTSISTITDSLELIIFSILSETWNLSPSSIDWSLYQSIPRKKWWGRRCRNGSTAPCGPLLLLLLLRLSTTTMLLSSATPPPLKCPQWRSKRRNRFPLLPRLPPLLRFRLRGRGTTVAVSLANMETLVLLLPPRRTFPARLISQLRSIAKVFDHRFWIVNWFWFLITVIEEGY